MITLTRKNNRLLTPKERHKIVLREIAMEELNIDAVKYLVSLWRELFSSDKHHENAIILETAILYSLQYHWGQKSLIEVNKENMKITCYSIDERKITL